MSGKEWYTEQCRKPEWQRRRLQIMERDGWQCRFCLSSDRTLSVHHRYYLPKRKPWEYPDSALITVCEPCHVPLLEVPPALITAADLAHERILAGDCGDSTLRTRLGLVREIHRAQGTLEIPKKGDSPT